MKKFSFRLKSILNYRRNLEIQAQRELHHARNECLEGEKAIERIKSRKKSIARSCSEKEHQGINVSLYQIYKSYLLQIDKDLNNLSVELQKSEEKVKDKTEKLKKALIKKKTLGTLEEAKYKRYLAQLEKKNQIVLDDLVVIKRGKSTWNL